MEKQSSFRYNDFDGKTQNLAIRRGKEGGRRH